MASITNVGRKGILSYGRVFLAPLEGVSDEGFRKICHNLGAAMTWTEMIRGSSIAKNNRASLDLIDTYDKNVPVGIQLSVKSGKELSSCLQNLTNLQEKVESRLYFQHIRDIQLNFGCPSRDIINEGGGPALLKRKQKLLEIFQILKDWTEENNNQYTIGCKIRLGLNNAEMESKVYTNSIEMANKVGLDYIVVHARHAAQRSSDQPFWSIIKEIKNMTNIPIIGNGNVLSCRDAIKMMQDTNCDGIMIARGAMNNPWIFKQLHFLNKANDIQSLDITDEMYLKHYWPTIDELNRVEKDYFDWINIHLPNNKKCWEFHKQNFQRIRKSIELQDFTVKSSNPSKIYL